MTTSYKPTPQVESLNGMSPLGLPQVSLEERVLKWTQDLVNALESNYDSRYPNSADPVRFEIESGRKYLKINQIHGGVHAFVNKKTGEVFKPASWRGPAKIVRYDFRIINEREACFANADWAGSYLYLR